MFRIMQEYLCFMGRHLFGLGVCVCPFANYMVTTLWLCLKHQKAEHNFPISFHNILGMNWWQNGHVLKIDVEWRIMNVVMNIWVL